MKVISFASAMVLALVGTTCVDAVLVDTQAYAQWGGFRNFVNKASEKVTSAAGGDNDFADRMKQTMEENKQRIDNLPVDVSQMSQQVNLPPAVGKMQDLGDRAQNMQGVAEAKIAEAEGSVNDAQNQMH